MDCVNHSGVSAAAYCQNCGKALCGECVRKTPAGQIFCEPCRMAWHGAQRPFVPPPPGAPSPGLAAFLGLIPGVGAMYNGQFIKGLVHIFIFAVLVSAANVYDVFGFFIAGWIFYQAFEAYHTARARRDGEPLPDPLGLNELSNALMPGGRVHQGAQPGAQAGPVAPGVGPASGYQTPGPMPGEGLNPAQNQPPYQGSYQGSYQGGPYQAPYQSAYQGPYAPGYTGPGVPPIPPIPPVPPAHWRRREPIGAVILIALGLLFLLGRMDWFSWHLFGYTWPVLLIGLGVWLIVRRMQETHGGSQENRQGGEK
ncbi:MAG: B-box zinc finger protein [Terracidiphilus sp.]|jgi:hypothetical protein